VPDSRILAIDRQRARCNVTHQALCELSGLDKGRWYELRRGAIQPNDRTVSQLEEALRRSPQPWPTAGLADFFWTVAGLFGEAYGLKPDDVFSAGQGPRLCSRCRRLAAYVITVELLVSNADLARAIGQTRQSVKQARDQVELWRDDPAIDGLLERVTYRVRWRHWNPPPSGRKRRGDL
jgi:hypothetical protein